MRRIFDILLLLYPADFREEFGAEMWSVFQSLKSCRSRSAEILGLLLGAAREHAREVTGLFSARFAVSIVGGGLIALLANALMYCSVLREPGKALARFLRNFGVLAVVLSVSAMLASAQHVSQDPATRELAKSIYRAAFDALRSAKTLDDLHKLSDRMDSPDWIFVDRLGRTMLTRQTADAELESMLALPPERRVTEMDIIWAERDGDHLTVLAWMGPHQAQEPDADGEFGAKGAVHGVTRGTLIRDVFTGHDNEWRRIRHDKLTPNDFVLAVDGSPAVLPPMAERDRVLPSN